MPPIYTQNKHRVKDADLCFIMGTRYLTQLFLIGYKWNEPHD